MADDDRSTPLVSVICPIRNEADFIERCLGTVLASDYPRERLEVIVVDGLSDDGTREIVTRLAAEDTRLRLIDNPQRIVPFAMNRGIRESKGAVIIRVDGHAEVEPDFVRQSVAVLQRQSEAWVAGGPIETISTTYVGRTIAGAMSTPVGVGDSAFRLGTAEGFVDTIAFGAHWRWVFDKIGLFDEELVRNQDDEFNARLIQHGGKIYMSQSIRSRYYPRSSLKKLWRQYYQYGFWRIRTVQKLGQPASARQMVPLAFVSGLVLLIVAALIWPPLGWLLAVYAALYVLGLLGGSIQVAQRTGLSSFFLAPWVFAILHFAYGIGSLKGLLWWVLLRRGPAVRPEEHAMSR